MDIAQNHYVVYIYDLKLEIKLNPLDFQTFFRRKFPQKLIKWIPLLLIDFGDLPLLQLCISFLPSPTPTKSLPNTPSKVVTPTLATTITLTPTGTKPPSITSTPTITTTPTITLTPPFDFPDGTVSQQVNCRYGHATANLFASGLFPGDKVEIIYGRNSSGSWLWVQPDSLKYQSWVAASLPDIQEDEITVWVKSVIPPSPKLYGPVTYVFAKRSGNEGTIIWEPVWMTLDDDRGYLIETNLCQNGVLIWQSDHTNTPSYTFSDVFGCSAPSTALLYMVEKHGYTDPIQVPWI